MPADIRVPALSESVVEATVSTWTKKPGDSVTSGDVVVELETDKVNVEVRADATGILHSIVKHEGDTVTPNELLGTIDSVDAATGTATAPTLPELVSSEQPVAAAPASVATAPAEHIRVTPLARQLAAESGVNLETVVATGPGGRIRRADVEHLVTQTTNSAPVAAPIQPVAAPPRPVAPAALPAPAATGPAYSPPSEHEERVPMSRRRRTIAQRLVEAKTVTAMLTTFNDCDLTAIMDMRKRRRDAYREKFGVSLGFMSFFTRASVGALKEFPRLNAEIRGDDLILKYHYDIGVAVDTPEGLVVPVVRDADRLSFVQIERTIAELAKRSREGKLSISDLQGATFTITNGGVFGSLMSTPIINMPQAAILGMHRIEERPVVRDGQVVSRPMMYLALTYDHRIVDGREAVQFLNRIKELVEDPERLLTEA